MTLRIGTVGTGWWADQVHLPAARASGLEQVGVYGRDPGRTATLAQSHGISAFSTFEQLLDAVDVVDFAVPPDVQAPLAIRAAAAGKHLMLEKPVAADAETAHSVQSAVETAGVASLVFFTRLFDPVIAGWVAEAKQHSWHSGSAELVGSAMTEVGSPWSTSGWRIERGGLWDNGPHGLATVIEVLGDVTEVRALAGRDGLVQAIFSHASGATSSMSVSISAPPTVDILDITFWGEAGVRSQPDLSVTPVQALVTALDQLAAMAADPTRRGESNLALGCAIVDVLARVEAEISGISAAAR